MDHLLARLKNVKLKDIKQVLLNDADSHSKEGLYLEHIWQNDEEDNEVLFLFRVDDLEHAKKFIDKVHSGALKENPQANLPVMTYLKGEK